MSITLVTTVGGETSNSYADVTYADEYFDGRFSSGTGWLGYTTAQKEARLLAASRMLETLKYVGKLVSDDQSMSWPRKRDDRAAFDMWASSGSTLIINKREYATDEIPTPILHAQCELALFVLDTDGNYVQSDSTTSSGDSVKSEKLGKWSVSYGSPTRISFPSKEVSDLLMPFLDLSIDVKRGS